MADPGNTKLGFPRWIKIPAYILFGFALLLIAARISLKTAWVHNLVKNYIVETANEQLTASLQVDRLSGDLWYQVILSDIHLVDEDTIATIDSVSINYDILSYFGDAFDIREVSILNPDFNIREENDSWNIANLTEPSGETAADTDPFLFRLHELNIEDGLIHLYAPSILKDSTLEVVDTYLNGSFEYYGDVYNASLNSLGFQLENTRLGSPVTVETGASADQNSITLERLVLASGRSLLQTSATVQREDSVISLSLQGEPIAWQDIAAYVETMPLNQDMEVELGLRGTLDDFEIELGLDAMGMDSLRLVGGVKKDTAYALQSLMVSANSINPEILLGDTTMPKLTDLKMGFTGEIPFSNYQSGNGTLVFSTNELNLDPYSFSSLAGKVELQAGTLNGNINAQNGRQQLSSVLRADGIWEEQPALTIKLNGKNIEPAYWSQDESMTGILHFNAGFSGEGWFPDKRRWNYTLDVRNSRLMDQPLQAVSLKGAFNLESVTAKGFFRLVDSRMDVNMNVNNLSDIPKYTYALAFRDFNILEVAGNDDYTSAISGDVSGTGLGLSPETLQLKTNVNIDSSIINGERIEHLTGDFQVRDTVIFIDSASLESTIAEGTFDGRYHMLRWYDRENELSFNLNLKEIQTLSALAGADSLQAEGSIKGSLKPVREEEMMFVGEIDLQNLVYDNINSEEAQGDVELHLKELPDYKVDLNLKRPSLPSVILQDLRLLSSGSILNEGPAGNFKLHFSGAQEGEITHSGSYKITPDTASVQTMQLDISSSSRTLSLQQPFNVVYTDNSIRTDTLKASSSDGAVLELAIPYADSSRQVGYLRGASLNTTIIQNTLLNESFFEGFLSGEIKFSREETELQATGDFVLSEFNYNGSRFETFSVNTVIKDERLNGTLVIREGGQRIIEGNADLPFKLGNPEDFDDAFFKEPVSGELLVNPIALNRFQQFLENAGVENTEGIFRFRGTLDGSAGSPEFKANTSLKNAVLSGVSVDSLTANMSYQHDLSLLKVNASVTSLKQKAAEIYAEMPLLIDLKTFNIQLPGEDDPVKVNVSTNRFNLAALNDFLDRSQTRNVQGELNGNVEIYGTVGELKADGKMALRNGSVRLVPAGITVDRIRSELLFEPGQLTLANFSARSGRGQLNAEGKMDFEKLVPGEMDVRITAENFRAMNRSAYNAIINMDLRSRGTFKSPKVTGDLIFLNGFVELDNFGEKSVEDVELDSEDEEPEVSVYDSLALEMNVSFNRRFFIRNQRYLEMQIELEGELDLVKEAGKDLELFGTMNAASGYARPLGKRFELQEGSVTFTGNPANPELAVRTRFMPPQTREEVVIWYIIEGTVEDPVFAYESDPQMELENIISYTLFGQPFYALDSWKQVVASSGSNTTATDVALDVLLDRVEALATQRLGIDVVKIDNTRQGAESGTSITTGWYINPRVFFAIQNVISGSSPDTGFLLEYLLKKNLKLIIRQENSSHQGVDLQWNFDY